MALIALWSSIAQATPVDTLRDFVRDVKTWRAEFTQVVTSPDGARKKTSSGRFEFARPGQFRFAYLKPYEQLIVSDGHTVWIHDPDLNQVTVRKLDAALGGTPAALLAGTGLERDFELSALPDHDGLSWAQAVAKQKDTGFQSLQVGFRGHELAAVEILDSFGQRSRLTFAAANVNPTLAATDFRFTPPAGAEVLQP